MLCGLSRAIDADVGAAPGPAHLSWPGGRAGVGALERAGVTGRAAGSGAGRRSPHGGALTRLVARAVPEDAAVAGDACAVHAAGARGAVAVRIGRALRGGDPRGADAVAGLAQPDDGARWRARRDRVELGSLSSRRGCT